MRLMRCSSIVLAILMIGWVVGCAGKPKDQSAALPQPQWLDKPAIDLSRGAASFPTEATDLPATADDLTAALTAGYALRLDPAGANPEIDVDAPNYPQIDRLHISLADGRVRSEYAPKNASKDLETIGELAVKRIEYIARPLRYFTHTTNLELFADDAGLEVVRDPADGKVSLSLVRAKAGRMTFSVTRDDLRASLTSGAKSRGGAAFAINGVEIQGASDNPRSLEGSVHIYARILLVPAEFTIGGRLDVDDNFNVLLSRLFVTGQDVGGGLIAAFLEPKVMKYDNKLMPLVRFPGDKMKLTDFRITLDDSLRLEVEFADK